MIRTYTAGLRGILAVLLVGTMAGWSTAEDTDLQKKVEALATEVQQLKSQVASKTDSGTGASHLSWLSVGGDLRTRHDILLGHTLPYTSMTAGAQPAQTYKNNSILTNRLGLNLGAKVAESVTFKARLLMYKAFGWNSADAALNSTGPDRQSIFDGNVGHVPQDNTLLVDYAYADINNIAGQPVWFSFGRRPSSGGVPTNVRRNDEVSGIGGVQGILTDYAFDGFTLGMAPDYAKLPGLATKLCYGRAYQTKYQNASSTNYLYNTDMLGYTLVGYETEDTRLDTQFQHAFHVMDNTPGNSVTGNIGSLQNLGLGGTHAFRKVGPGDLNVFGYGALSRSMPNSTLYGGMAGLLYSAGQTPTNHTGKSIYLGTRYDITKTKTKVGFEFNAGSKYWINFTPAADDLWTSKLGTRGQVYEGYVIQELFREPTSTFGKVFFRLGYQYYNFTYTGSNSWLGDPVKMSEITQSSVLMMPPLKNAYDIYATAEVRF